MNDELNLRDLSEPPPEAYETVRRRVMVDIRRGKRIAAALRSVAAAAACLLLIWGASLWMRRPVPAVGSPPMLAQAPAPPAIASAPVRRVVHHRLRRPRSSAPLLARTQPLVIKMQTDDPNVVILWMVD